MPHCLLTGATGFIGPRLATLLLQAGGEVRCLVRKSSDTSRLQALGRVKLVEGDVTQPETLASAVAGVDFVFHLAGRTFAKSYDQFAQVNEAGTDSITAACAAQSNPPVLVVVSSLAAAGPSPRQSSGLDETDAPQPVSNYGRSKLAGELAARGWASEVPMSIVRPPVVFGPGDKAGLLLVRSLQKTGLHVIHRPGLPLSLIHADDLAEALLLVARHGERIDPTDPRSQGLYYAVDPAESSYREMGEMIATALDRPLRILKVRRWALTVAALASEASNRLRGTTSPLNLDKVREATASGWVASPQKIMTQMNFHPAAPLQERYQQTIDWYRTEGWI